MAAAVLAALTAPAAADDELTATTLKVERAYNMAHALLAVDNSGDGYDWATFSCVFTAKNEPVYEGSAFIQKIVARGRTISRIGFFYNAAVDKITCRLVSTGPQR
jgi:hypothetical protein